jgi:hypothetical protein
MGYEEPTPTDTPPRNRHPQLKMEIATATLPSSVRRSRPRAFGLGADITDSLTAACPLPQVFDTLSCHAFKHGLVS